MGWPFTSHGSGFALDPYACSIVCTVAVIRVGGMAAPRSLNGRSNIQTKVSPATREAATPMTVAVPGGDPNRRTKIKAARALPRVPRMMSVREMSTTGPFLWLGLP